MSEIWPKMYVGLHVKYRLFLSDLIEPWNFSTHFRKIFRYVISLQSVQWEPSCSIRTDGQMDRQTDMTKLLSLFRSLRKALKTRPKFYLAAHFHCQFSGVNASWLQSLGIFGATLPCPRFFPKLDAFYHFDMCDIFRNLYESVRSSSRCYGNTVYNTPVNLLTPGNFQMLCWHCHLGCKDASCLSTPRINDSSRTLHVI